MSYTDMIERNWYSVSEHVIPEDFNKEPQFPFQQPHHYVSALYLFITTNGMLSEVTSLCIIQDLNLFCIYIGSESIKCILCQVITSQLLYKV